MSAPVDRLTHLRAYLVQLARDLKQRGAFRPDEESVEAYALAVLEGATAIGAQLWADVKTVGKQGLAIAEPLAVGSLKNLGERAVGAFAERAVDYAASHLDGRAARRKTGKRIMEIASNLGKRRGGRP